MNRITNAFVAFLFVGCGDAPDINAPPIDYATCPEPTEDGGELDSSTGGAVVSVECTLFLNCREQCHDDEPCVDACASVSEVDVESCLDHLCDELTEACALGDVDACSEVPTCADASSSGTGSTGSSSSGSMGSMSGSSSSSAGSSTTDSSSGSSSDSGSGENSTSGSSTT